MNPNVLGALQWVTGGVSLIAFLAALAFYAYRSRLKASLDIIQTAPEKDRVKAIDAFADRFSVDTSGLTKDQKLQVVMRQLQIRAHRQYIIAVSAVFIGTLFLALAFVAIHLGK